MSSFSPSRRLSAAAGRRIALVLAIVLAGFTPVPLLRADANIYDYVVTEGTEIIVSGTPTVVILDASGGTYPILGEINVTSTDFSTYYELQIFTSGVNGATPYQSGVSAPALLQFSNNADSVSGSGSADIHFWNAPGAFPDQISSTLLQ